MEDLKFNVIHWKKKLDDMGMTLDQIKSLIADEEELQDFNEFVLETMESDDIDD